MNEIKQGIFLRNMAGKDAVISIIGVIGWDVSYPILSEMLKAIPETVERVIFEIYSPGGDIWEGNGIIQQIGAMKQTTVARVQVAASMATLIAVACKEREIAGNGRFLIHNPWTQLAGDAEMLEKRAKELRDCEVEAAKFYAARTGKTPEDMLVLMEEERWLTPQEALDLGFVQKINDPFDQAAFAAVKSAIVAAGKWPKALAEIPETIQKEIKSMKEPEIKAPVKVVPEVKPEEEKHDNANPAGSEVKADAKPDLPAKPADEKPKEEKPEISTEYQRGLADSKVACELEHSKHITDLTAQITRRDELIRGLQSEKDKALNALPALERKLADREIELQSQITKLNDALKDANERHSKLLAGGLTFAPAAPESWEEAMAQCNGDYAIAAKKYPKLRDEYNARMKRKK